MNRARCDLPQVLREKSRCALWRVAKIGASAVPDLAETYTAADLVRERRRREENRR